MDKHAKLERLVPTLHIVSIYALLEGLPRAAQISAVHLARLKIRLHDASRGRYGRDMALEICNTARDSIGSVMLAKSLELRHTIQLIRMLNVEIDEIEVAIQIIMNELHSPITSIFSIGEQTGAMILAGASAPCLTLSTSC